VAGAAHCRWLAGRIVAAVAERAGFVIVTEAPFVARRALVQAIAEFAAAQFLVVEIGGPGGSLPARPSMGTAAGASASAPLFVVDDAALHASVGLRDICETAPLSHEWAAMLSVRAVLITAAPIAELQFLGSRLAACIPFAGADLAAGDAAPAGPTRRGPPAEAAPAQPWRGPVWSRKRSPVLGPAAAAGRGAGSDAAPPQPQSAGRRRAVRRDLRPYALLAYLAAILVLTGCYVALQLNRPAGAKPPAGVAGAAPPRTGEASDGAVLGPEIAK